MNRKEFAKLTAKAIENTLYENGEYDKTPSVLKSLYPYNDDMQRKAVRKHIEDNLTLGFSRKTRFGQTLDEYFKTSKYHKCLETLIPNEDVLTGSDIDDIKCICYEAYKAKWLSQFSEEKRKTSFDKYIDYLNSSSDFSIPYDRYLKLYGVLGEKYETFYEFLDNEFLNYDYMTELVGKEFYEKMCKEPNFRILGEILFTKVADETGLNEVSYHIKGDTLIIDEDVTAVKGKDFHTYEENYVCVKDKFAKIKKVIIPDSVTKIGTDAFCDFMSLEDITLPNGITNIEYYAFSGCTSLKSIIIPDNVECLEACAFENCTELSSITLPDSVGVIDVGVFENCKKLTIICNEGSFAEEFANEEGIPVKHIKDKTKAIERE